MEVIKSSDIPSLSLLYKLNKLAPAASNIKELPTSTASPERRSSPTPSKRLNDRVGLFRGDITVLAVDAIVNAANGSLLGGSGVNGAIHRAAGPSLLAECKTLKGCQTGSAKITAAYNLPCRKVIHAVGPVYRDLAPEASAELLYSCYTRSLELSAENQCRTVAFSSLSTGIYGYPSTEAASVAIKAVRAFLERDTAESIQKVVFVTFELKEVDAYRTFLPLYFPPVPEVTTDAEDIKPVPVDGHGGTGTDKTAAVVDLPSAPTGEPLGAGHVNKKQKHDDGLASGR